MVQEFHHIQFFGDVPTDCWRQYQEFLLLDYHRKELERFWSRAGSQYMLTLIYEIDLFPNM